MRPTRALAAETIASARKHGQAGQIWTSYAEGALAVLELSLGKHEAALVAGADRPNDEAETLYQEAIDELSGCLVVPQPIQAASAMSQTRH
jgi:hypothetical protein